VKYAFIDGQRTQHPVRRLCELLEVSSAGYYEWRGRPCSFRSTQDERLRAEIVRVHAASRKTYGRPRIHAELREQGLKVGAKRIARLMKTSGIHGVRPRRFVRTTDSKHPHPIAENILARTFDPNVIGGVNRVWAGDITYLPTREGWLYLAVVLDLGSRRVVGWSMESTMHDDLVIAALDAALRQRRPQDEVLFHSDRGSQYASHDFRATANRHNIRLSMSGKGDCWDNAVVESFFGTLKTELGDPVWPTRDAARSAVFNYIETWYNLRRRHSALGYVSPNQYESLLPIAA
jgi:putative transposase